MSADNGYMIRKHPKGGYAAVHYFMSDEGEITASEDAPSYPTPMDAYWAVDSEWTEYGTTFHPEIKEGT